MASPTTLSEKIIRSDFLKADKLVLALQDNEVDAMIGRGKCFWLWAKVNRLHREQWLRGCEEVVFLARVLPIQTNRRSPDSFQDVKSWINDIAIGLLPQISLKRLIFVNVCSNFGSRLSLHLTGLFKRAEFLARQSSGMSLHETSEGDMEIVWGRATKAYDVSHFIARYVRDSAEYPNRFFLHREAPTDVKDQERRAADLEIQVLTMEEYMARNDWTGELPPETANAWLSAKRAMESE